jgi:hypothetical protein
LERVQKQAVARDPASFSGYPYGYSLDLYVVLSPTRETAGGDGFWVQPFGDGSSGSIQPVRVAIAQ